MNHLCFKCILQKSCATSIPKINVIMLDFYSPPHLVMNKTFIFILISSIKNVHLIIYTLLLVSKQNSRGKSFRGFYFANIYFKLFIYGRMLLSTGKIHIVCYSKLSMLKYF